MTNQITEKINKLCAMSKYCAGPKQVINDMAQLAFNVLATTPAFAMAFPGTSLYVDEGMTAEVRRYEHDPEAWALLQELVLDFFHAVKSSEPFTDVIGAIYGDLVGKNLAQFLTPKKVADGVVAMQLAFMPQHVERITLGDPTGCGTGSMILAALRNVLKKHGKDSLGYLDLVVMDIDPNMVRLCCLQVVLSAVMHRIPLMGFEAHCGDTIRDYNGPKKTLAFGWRPCCRPSDQSDDSELQLAA
jgi:hypothetical protein